MKSRKVTSISPQIQTCRTCVVDTVLLGRIAVAPVTTCVTMHPMESNSEAPKPESRVIEAAEILTAPPDSLGETQVEANGPKEEFIPFFGQNAYVDLEVYLQTQGQDAEFFLWQLVDRCPNTPKGRMEDAVDYFKNWLLSHPYDPANWKSPAEFARTIVGYRMIDFARAPATVRMPADPETGEEIEFPSRDARMAVIPWWERFKEAYKELTPVEAAGVHFGQEIFDSELEEHLRSETPPYFVPATPAGKNEVDYSLGERGRRHVFEKRDSANRAYLRGKERLVEILGTDFIEGMDR